MNIMTARQANKESKVNRDAYGMGLEEIFSFINREVKAGNCTVRDIPVNKETREILISLGYSINQINQYSVTVSWE